jgi:hypothetical protein
MKTSKLIKSAGTLARIEDFASRAATKPKTPLRNPFKGLKDLVGDPSIQVGNSALWGAGAGGAMEGINQLRSDENKSPVGNGMIAGLGVGGGHAIGKLLGKYLGPSVVHRTIQKNPQGWMQMGRGRLGKRRQALMMKAMSRSVGELSGLGGMFAGGIGSSAINAYRNNQHDAMKKQADVNVHPFNPADMAFKGGLAGGIAGAGLGAIGGGLTSLTDEKYKGKRLKMLLMGALGGGALGAGLGGGFAYRRSNDAKNDISDKLNKATTGAHTAMTDKVSQMSPIAQMLVRKSEGPSLSERLRTQGNLNADFLKDIKMPAFESLGPYMNRDKAKLQDIALRENTARGLRFAEDSIGNSGLKNNLTDPVISAIRQLSPDDIRARVAELKNNPMTKSSFIKSANVAGLLGAGSRGLRPTSMIGKGYAGLRRAGRTFNQTPWMKNTAIGAGGAGLWALGRGTGYEKGNQAGYATGLDQGLGQGYGLAQNQAQNTGFIGRLMGNYEFDPSQLRGIMGQGLQDPSIRQQGRHGIVGRYAGLPFV